MPISEVYNIDCLEYMATCKDKQFDLAIVDPPYGIGDTTISAGNTKRKIKIKGKWNNYIPEESYFKELFRISNNQIIWGGNYFPLPPHRCFIVWYKEPVLDRFSDFEYAWASFNSKPLFYHLQYTNIINRDSDYPSFHPTQKPVQLYKWLLKNYTKPGDTIFDSHLGSGSSRIACYEGGFDFVGCELDKEYFDASVKRFENYRLQLKLF